MHRALAAGRSQVGFLDRLACCALAITLSLAAGCRAGAKSDATPAAASSSNRRAMALSIVNELAETGRRSALLAGFDPRQHQIEDMSEPFLLSYRYEQGLVGSKPNPGYEPSKKGQPTLPVYTDDGVAFSLYFFEGDWQGAAVVRPRRVGSINVVLLADGPQAEEVEDLLWRIVDRKG